MRLAVIGTGYVGLVAGAGFADAGNDVVCVDRDADRITRLRRGELPLVEPRLAELVGRNLRGARLAFSTDITDAVPGADVIVIAVGTPQGEHGAPDLRAIDETARAIGRTLDGPAVIVVKSTVPVGTADRIRALIAAETRVAFAMASNPEFLKEGDAVNDFLRPDRVILGVDDEATARLLRTLYAPFVRVPQRANASGVNALGREAAERILVMDIRSAELTKYAANSMLAVRISFMNELALLAEKLGADIEKVRRGIGSDPRIGPRFLFAGPGFGGSCFPKDLRALAHAARQHGASVEVVEATERANQRQKRVLGERVRAHFGGDLAGRRIAVWGLTFKPETDDIREAPALTLVADLIEAGATVVGYDPAAMDRVRTLGLRLELAADMYSAARGAHALVLVTEWKQFRAADFRRLHAAMAEPTVFDGRNIWDPELMRDLGFRYHAIGRGAPNCSTQREVGPR